MIVLGVWLAAAQVDPVSAQSADGGSAFGGLMESLGLKSTTAPAPEFVRKSRPGEGSLDYMPVGAPHPANPIKVMTPAEVAAATDALDGARMTQQRRAGVKPIPVPLKKAAGGAAQKKGIR